MEAIEIQRIWQVSWQMLISSYTDPCLHVVNTLRQMFPHSEYTYKYPSYLINYPISVGNVCVERFPGGKVQTAQRILGNISTIIIDSWMALPWANTMNMTLVLFIYVLICHLLPRLYWGWLRQITGSLCQPLGFLSSEPWKWRLNQMIVPQSEQSLKLPTNEESALQTMLQLTGNPWTQPIQTQRMFRATH